MALNDPTLDEKLNSRHSESFDRDGVNDSLMKTSSGSPLISSLGQRSIPRPSPRASYAWLFVYFFFNLALTIYNKFVLAGDFPFPYTLTAVHALSGSIGSFICWKKGLFTTVTLTTRETVQIILFSGLYTINIVVSNVSLYDLSMAN
jgi:hypothetical protein